ncbi:MAG: dihydrofolate reductase family protein [Gemmatimonadaceae bacterium]|nr:dihydrofolate reductase family protein [Gemmatimonadaceae bacterium]
MSKVFFDVGMSLDGYIAGPNRGPKNPLGDGGPAMHEWIVRTATFREIQHLGEGGETGSDDERVKQLFGRAGAHVMGRNMFEEGEANWPEEAPFHAPVFVLTHDQRAPWVRTGGTTFYFVTDGIESALAQARAAAQGKDVRIAGGAYTIKEYLHAGHIDEFTLHLAPMLLGEGVRLLDRFSRDKLKLEQVDATGSELVTHIGYRVVR